MMFRVLSAAYLVFAVVTPGATAEIRVQKARTNPHTSHHQVSLNTAVHKRVAALRVRTGIIQEPDSYTNTEHESWFDRMGDAFSEFILGVVMITFSIPVLWFNEKRKARMDSIIALGESECVPVNVAKDEHRGDLVHVSGGIATASGPIADDAFPEVAFKEDCLRLRRTVEVFQEIEHKSTHERKDMVGGGKTKTTTYTYKPEWSSTAHDNNAEEGHKNTDFKCSPGEFSTTCSRVEYGQRPDGFVLPESLVAELNQWESACKRLGKTVSTRGMQLTKNEDWYYSATASSPQLGDVRAKFDLIPDGPATIVGLQLKGSKDMDSFGPYRMISRGICCWRVSHEEQQQLLILEAEKKVTELYEQDKCSCGPLSLCCCCCIAVCNLVSFCFAALLTPQIYHMFHGTKTPGECISSIKAESSMMVWILRLVGWFLLFSGTYALFSPLLVFVDIIPFLGPLLSTFGGALIWIMCLVVTLIVASLIVSVAYLVYRPCLGAFYLSMVAAMTAGIYVVLHGMMPVPH